MNNRLYSLPKPIREKLVEIKNLKPNWDGDDAFVPTKKVIEKTTVLLMCLPSPYTNLLLALENEMYATSYGTITIEWRPDEHNMLSIEIGNTTSNFYALLNNNVAVSDDKKEVIEQLEFIHYYLRKLFPLL